MRRAYGEGMTTSLKSRAACQVVAGKADENAVKHRAARQLVAGKAEEVGVVGLRRPTRTPPAAG
jgi:hypothetical protein